MDIRKAYDSVPHSKLLFILWKVEIVRKIWSLLKDYFDSRLQCVVVEGKRSNMLSVVSGFPQGSIFGPLLFIIYINDLPQATPLFKVVMFSDDSKVLMNITNESDCHIL